MPVVSPVFTFVWSGRQYQAKLLRATKPRETNAIVYGLGLNPKLDKVWVVFRGDEGWWHPAYPKGLTALARAAVAAATVGVQTYLAWGSRLYASMARTPCPRSGDNCQSSQLQYANCTRSAVWVDMKTAKLVARNVKPVHTHDCSACRFLGRLNGKDLYVCHRATDTGGRKVQEFVARFGSSDREYTSLGDWTPEGTEYSLAAEILRRGLPPNAYRAD